jgi:hypothetical protein
MASFVVEELRYNGSTRKYESAVPALRFEWTAKAKSSPVDGWPYEIAVRTVRDNYPGNDATHEQVFGSHFEPFTLRGRWDDRWAGEGFAKRTRSEFTDLVRKCGPVRFAFDDLSFVGIITRFRPTYRYAWLCEYEFEVSPHTDEKSDRRDLDGKKVAPVRDYQAQVNQIAEEMKALHARAPVRYMVGVIHPTVTTRVEQIAARTAQISAVIEGRVLAFQDSVTNSVAKVVADLEGLRKLAIGMRNDLSAASAGTDIYFDDTVISLSYDAWAKGLMAQARALAVLARAIAKELRRRVAPDAQALYRPRAGESLYDLANRFFGTPSAWRLIAERNSLYQMELDGTELLIIPART